MKRSASWLRPALGAYGVFVLCNVLVGLLVFGCGYHSPIYRLLGDMADAMGEAGAAGVMFVLLGLPAFGLGLATYAHLRQRARRGPILTEPPGIGRAEIASAWLRARRWLLPASEGIPWKLAVVSFVAFCGTLFVEQLLLSPWSPLSSAWDALARGAYAFAGLLLGRFVTSVLLVVVPFAVAIVVFTKLYRHRLRDTEFLHCLKCGYILKGLSEPRCPECGERI